MIICKFGGSSVATKTGAEKIKEIINKNNNRKIVVVSALGKSEKYNYKITDKLYELYFFVKNNLNYEKILENIFNRYKELSQELSVRINWNLYKNRLINDIKNNNYSKEYLVSRGEYYSAIIYSKYLNAEFLDAKNYIVFNKIGKINEKLTKNRLKILNFDKCYVIGGFYGASINGEICVFDRGGSDITGAIICKLLNFEIYENYTDVCGVYNKNPNLFLDAKNLPLVSYKMAIKMADSGNEVVHKQALIEMQKSNSLLVVKSTIENNKLGTIVVDCELKTNDVYVCASSVMLAEFDYLTGEYLEKIKKNTAIDKAILNNGKYYLIIKNLEISKDVFKSLYKPNELYAVKLFTIFSKIEFNNKCLKNMIKIQKKLKKYGVLGLFLSKNNNFVIICKEDFAECVVNVLNQHLQNG